MEPTIESRITIVPYDPPGSSHGMFDVYHEGRFLLRSHDPELQACRRLMHMGISGALSVWRIGQTVPHMLIKNIGRAAGYRTADPNHGSVKFVKWTPHPGFSLNSINVDMEDGE
jgi:hypothetical protein